MHPSIKFFPICNYEMKNSIDRANCINRVGVFQAEDMLHRRTSVILCLGLVKPSSIGYNT